MSTSNSLVLEEALACAAEALSLTLGGHALLRVIPAVERLVALDALGRSTGRRDGVSVGFSASEKSIVEGILDRVPSLTPADIAAAEAAAKAGSPGDLTRIRVARARLKGLVYMASRLDAARLTAILERYGRSGAVIAAVAGTAGAFQRLAAERGIPADAPADQDALEALLLERLGGKGKRDRSDLERAHEAIKRGQAAFELAAKILELELPPEFKTWIAQAVALCGDVAKPAAPAAPATAATPTPAPVTPAPAPAAPAPAAKPTASAPTAPAPAAKPTASAVPATKPTMQPVWPPVAKPAAKARRAK